jgi:pSer/pThr/pTyr-binding forkhead associated (FHA) protein
VAKLAIYRGDTLDREVDLAPRTSRIGRSDQNEIVLPDPAKSVSRFHAEIRFENGKFSIVDLNSQNGTWVAGKRVQQVALEAASPVVLGTYRLVYIPDLPPMDSEKTMVVPSASASGGRAPGAVPPPPPPQVVPAPAPAQPAVAAPSAVPKPIEVAAPPPLPAPAPKPAVAPVQAAAVKPELPKPEPPKPQPPKAEAPKPAAAAPPPAPKPAAPAPPPKPAPAPAPAPAAPAPGAPAGKPAAATGKGGKKMLVVGAFVVLVLAAVAAGLFLWPQQTGTPTPAQQAQATPAPVPGGPPTETPAATPPAASSEAPPAARPATSAPPVQPPPHAAQSATARPSEPAAAPKAAPATARPPRPAADGAAATPRDRKDAAAATRKTAEPKARPLNLAQSLEQARSAMIKGDYLTAVSNLQAIVKVDPNYQDASQMLDMAKSGARNAAQLAIDSGTKSEMSGDYDAAIRQYEQAQQLDPGSQPAADAMKRVHARMQSDGEDAFRRARQFDALGRSSDAIAMYEKAIKLLPADHANVKAAKERLAALRGGN